MAHLTRSSVRLYGVCGGCMRQMVSHRITRGIHLSNRTEFHGSVGNRVGEPLLIGVGIAAIAYGGKLAIETFDKYQTRSGAAPAASSSEQKQGEEERTGWFGAFTASRFYEGGFEEKMSKREAALILGVRESSSRERVREAHRRLAMLNHPDTGGSTYIATKINEAKEKLLN